MIIIKQINNQIGGTERQTLYLVEQLKRKNINYLVLYVVDFIFPMFRFWMDSLLLLWEILKNSQVKVIYFMVGIEPSSLLQGLLVTYPYILVGIIGEMLGIRVVIRLVLTGNYKKFMNYLPQSILDLFDYVCLSPIELRVVRKKNKKSRCECIINGLDLKTFYPCDVEKDENFTFGYIGRFSKEKNLLMLIEAYSKLPDIVRNRSKLLLIGANPSCCSQCKNYYNIVRKKVKNLDLETNIIIRPYIPFSESEKLSFEYSKFDVSILPTITEGCPNSVMESIACGVPVIVFKDLLEILPHSLCWIFEKLTVEALTEQLEKAMRECNSARKKKCRRWAIKNLNINTTTKQSIQFLTEEY